MDLSVCKRPLTRYIESRQSHDIGIIAAEYVDVWKDDQNESIIFVFVSRLNQTLIEGHTDFDDQV